LTWDPFPRIRDVPGVKFLGLPVDGVENVTRVTARGLPQVQDLRREKLVEGDMFKPWHNVDDTLFATVASRHRGTHY
jgi:hypothetical protein